MKKVAEGDNIEKLWDFKTNLGLNANYKNPKIFSSKKNSYPKY